MTRMAGGMKNNFNTPAAFGAGIARGRSVPVKIGMVDRCKGGLGRFLPWWGRLPHLFRDRTPIAEGGDPGILAVTADVGLYSCILNASCASGWRAEWAASVGRAVSICSSKSIRIVVYDSKLPYVDWQVGLREIAGAPSNPRILVASPRVDEDLWRTVLRLRGYDVLARSANSEQLRRELRFASLSLGHS
jgi:hypothetical protein